MRMTLVDTGIGDTGKLRLMQLLDGGSTAIAHTGTQSTDHLIDDFLHGSLVRHATGNALWNEFLDILRICLEIAVLRAMFHSLQRTHATIALKLTTIVDDSVARTLLGTGNQRTDHHT